MSRRLTPEEQAVWRRVTASVNRTRPLPPETGTLGGPMPRGVRPAENLARAPFVTDRARPALSKRPFHNTLDGGWDRRISKGALDPDFTVDLHGETLTSAHAKLNRMMTLAIRSEARIVLLITGKPAADNPRLPPTSRGVIRASVKDWLAASSFSGHIAAIRGAHQRHGGAGALYIILRRGG